MRKNLFKYAVFALLLGGSYSLSQGTVIKLNQSIPPFSVVEKALFASNNTAVVYLLNTNSGSGYNIYSVPVTGGNPINLSQLNGGIFVFSLKISPDGARAFYIANAANPLRYDLYSVPVDGSNPPTKLSSINVDGGQVHEDYAITPDGENVIYRANQESVSSTRIYIAPTAQPNGSALVSGITYDPPMDDVDSLGLTPDGSTIIFEGNMNNNLSFEIFKIPTFPSMGETNIPLSGPAAMGGGSAASTYFVISPTGDRVAFRMDKEVNGKNEFYSIPITGIEAPLKLNANIDNAEDAATGGSVFSPDGKRILYTSQEAPGPLSPRYLYNVASDNPNDKLQVNPNFGDSNQVVVSGIKIGFAWNSKGDRIVYMSDQLEKSGLYRLFRASVNGGSAISLNDNFVANGIVKSMAVVPNGRAVLYTANKENVAKDELFFVPIRGGKNQKVSALISAVPNNVNNVGVSDFEMSSDSKFVIYTSTQENKDKRELYITAIPPVRDVTADFDGDLQNDILLRKGSSLRILTRNNTNGTFEFKNLLTLFPKKHKLLAVRDINGDFRPELILKKGKAAPFTMTSTTNLLLTNSSIVLPALAKGFKVNAAGYIDSNIVLVATKKKFMRVYSKPFGSTTNSSFIEQVNPKGFKAVGFGSFNEEPAVILRKKRTYNAISITTTASNTLSFGTTFTNIGTLPKKYKGFAAAPYLEDINSDIDIVIRKGKDIRILDLLAGSSTNTQSAKVLVKQDKKFKVIGPK